MGTVKIMAAFAAGMACGVLATRSYFSKKYKSMADEEIESMKDVMNRKEEKRKEAEVEHEREQHIRREYHKHVDNYISSVPPTETEMASRQNPTDEDSPFEIGFDEYSSDGFYDKIGLTYYVGDDVLVSDDVPLDENGPFTDPEETIGNDIFESFKEDDSNEIFVRNPNIGIDYDLIKDPGYYNEQ